MKALDYLRSLENPSGLDLATRTRLWRTAYPDLENCTGDDALCTCSWHDWRRTRCLNPPGDPYGVQAAFEQYDREWRQTMIKWMRSMIPKIAKLTPDTLPEWLSLLETIQHG